MGRKKTRGRTAQAPKKKNYDEVPKERNFVAKYMNEFNHAVVHMDRKKAEKNMTQRKEKHKGRNKTDLYL